MSLGLGRGDLLALELGGLDHGRVLEVRRLGDDGLVAVVLLLLAPEHLELLGLRRRVLALEVGPLQRVGVLLLHGRRRRLLGREPRDARLGAAADVPAVRPTGGRAG